MKRYYSLKKNMDFQFTYRVGKSVGCKLCTIVYVHDRRAPRPSSRPKAVLPRPPVRVGFSVSKKVGNSVMRNRCKRRLRAAFEPYLLNIRHGRNIIIIARAAVLDAPFNELTATIGQLLQKADLLMKGRET